MWNYIRTELECNRVVLGIGLAVAVAISLSIGSESDSQASSIGTAFLILYVISATVGAATLVNEKRVRLYTQLPLTRIQIVIGDLVIWLAWTALFYSVASLTAVILFPKIETGFFVDMLSTYLLAMSVMALWSIAFDLSNFRNRHWQIAYFCFVIACIIALAEGAFSLHTLEGRLHLVVFAVPLQLPAVASLLAIATIGAMYFVQSRQDFYLK
jgi:hypothetical protein